VNAAAAVVAEADAAGRTRLTRLRSEAPLTLRPTAGAVYLVAGAAGPVGGDDLELTVAVGPGARLVLRTVAATVALPGAGASTYTLALSVAAGGSLAVLPEPTVIAAGARHRTTVRATVATGGRLVLREEVLLGRHGEAGGAVRALVRVDAAGAPLLRHELALDGADPSTLARASMVGARACGTLLVVDPQWTDPARRPAAAASGQVAVLPLAGPGLLVSALADDARTLRAHLDRHLAGCGWTPR